MVRVSLNQSVHISLSLQSVHDDGNKHWYVTFKALFASERHLSINVDLFNPIGFDAAPNHFIHDESIILKHFRFISKHMPSDD